MTIEELEKMLAYLDLYHLKYSILRMPNTKKRNFHSKLRTPFGLCRVVNEFNGYLHFEVKKEQLEKTLKKLKKVLTLKPGHEILPLS